MSIFSSDILPVSQTQWLVSLIFYTAVWPKKSQQSLSDTSTINSQSDLCTFLLPSQIMFSADQKEFFMKNRNENISFEWDTFTACLVIPEQNNMYSLVSNMTNSSHGPIL